MIRDGETAPEEPRNSPSKYTYEPIDPAFPNRAAFGFPMELHFSFCFTKCGVVKPQYLELNSPHVDANHTSISRHISPKGVLPEKMGLDEVDSHW
jgi:hypothetical protein